MPKKKSQSQQTNTSPEDFIRLNSHELPVHGCWIAEDWKFDKMATIVIARKHPSGNISFCIYLVDLACLGVKGSLFKYNELPENFNKIIREMEENISIQPASYELVHNVIQSAVGFAGKYGFKPDKTFEFVTQYFLEEDSDEIPKMEIACGDANGNPVYIYMGYENPERAMQIQRHLEKISSGNSSNFSMMEDEDEDEDSIFGPSILDDIFADLYDEDYYDEEDEETKEIIQMKEDLYGLNIDELKERFFELYDKYKDDISDNEYMQLKVVTDVLIEEFTDDEIIADFYSDLSDDLTTKTTATEKLPNSIFQGIQNIDGDELNYMLDSTITNIFFKDKATSAINKFGKKTGDVPLIKYLKLFNMYKNGNNKYDKAITELYPHYPDYFLIKMLWYEYLYKKGDKKAFGKLKGLLHDKKLVITDFEYSEFVAKYAAVCFKIYEKFSFEKCVALESFYKNNLREEVYSCIEIRARLNLKKIEKMAEYLSK